MRATCAPTTGRVNLPELRVTASRRSGVGDDRMAIKASTPLVDMAASPTIGGVSFSLRDAGGEELYGGCLPAEGVVDPTGNGASFKFRDTKGLYPTANGVVSARIKRIASKGVARLNLKARGIDFAPFAGVGSIAFSVLVGPDTSAGDRLSARGVDCSASVTALRCLN
jgi:hypothetical protein